MVKQSRAHAAHGLQQVSGELRMVAVDLKMQLGDIKLEIGKLRNEIKELRDEFRKGNRPTVVGNSVVFVVFVAILVAVQVAMLWKN